MLPSITSVRLLRLTSASPAGNGAPQRQSFAFPCPCWHRWVLNTSVVVVSSLQVPLCRASTYHRDYRLRRLICDNAASATHANVVGHTSDGARRQWENRFYLFRWSVAGVSSITMLLPLLPLLRCAFFVAAARGWYCDTKHAAGFLTAGECNFYVTKLP